TGDLTLTDITNAMTDSGLATDSVPVKAEVMLKALTQRSIGVDLFDAHYGRVLKSLFNHYKEMILSDSPDRQLYAEIIAGCAYHRNPSVRELAADTMLKLRDE